VRCTSRTKAATALFRYAKARALRGWDRPASHSPAVTAATHRFANRVWARRRHHPQVDADTSVTTSDEIRARCRRPAQRRIPRGAQLHLDRSRRLPPVPYAEELDWAACDGEGRANGTKYRAPPDDPHAEVPGDGRPTATAFQSAERATTLSEAPPAATATGRGDVAATRRCLSGQRRANAPCGVTRIAAEALPPNIVGHLSHPSGRKR
jgi:hypothetical protein